MQYSRVRSTREISFVHAVRMRSNSRGAADAQLQFKTMCERPPRSLRSRLPLTRGRLRPQRESFILPLREGESRRRRPGGSLTRHLELELGNTPEGHGHLAFATVTTGVTHGYTLTRLRG